MTDEVSVEATGETVGEAKWAALRELERRAPGLDKSAVRFQVVSEGERGLLGVGYEPARVIAAVAAAAVPAAAGSPRPGEHPDDGPDAALVRELVERLAAELGIECTVTIQEDDEQLVALCDGPDLGLLIGRHGQTIDAVQYLANAMVRRRGDGERRRVVVDAAGYREHREATLRAVAHRSAERAIATGHPVDLEPMTAIERKVVHEFLKDDPEVETTGEGTEPNRYVVVLPRRRVD